MRRFRHALLPSWKTAPPLGLSHGLLPPARIPRAMPVSNRPYSGCNVVLLWMAQAAGYRTPRYLTFKQALDLGGHVRKGEHGTKVYFVKQLQVRDQRADDSSETHV
jgi:antirestriction protein ArdC